MSCARDLKLPKAADRYIRYCGTVDDFEIHFPMFLGICSKLKTFLKLVKFY